MGTTVLLALIFSAFVHAAWNLASRRYRHLDGFLWSIFLWSILYTFLLLPFIWDSLIWSWYIIGYGIISGLGLAVYCLFVKRSYDEGEVSHVYPLIRSSPVWVALLSATFLGEQLSPIAWVGVLCGFVGVYIVPRKSLSLKDLFDWKAFASKATLFALAASAGTCVYSIVDKMAMGSLVNPFGGIAFYAISGPISMIGWKLLDPKADQGFNWKTFRIEGLPLLSMHFFSMCCFLAYVIVVSAMAYGGAGRVIAVTNLGVVLGAIGGVVFFKERDSILPRLTGLAFVVAGITLLKIY